MNLLLYIVSVYMCIHLSAFVEILRCTASDKVLEFEAGEVKSKSTHQSPMLFFFVSQSNVQFLCRNFCATTLFFKYMHL